MTIKTITARAKFFTSYGIETLQCRVDDEGNVLVWDSIAGHYTAMHALSRPALRRIRRLARG